jgi:hypothetical protein
LWYNELINNNLTVKELIASLIQKGGRIDKYYLRDWNKNKATIVYLKGWFKGKNIREALVKALNPLAP